MTEKFSNLSLNFKIKSVVDDWVFGTFFMVVDGLIVGNESDSSVDMRGCLMWWLDLANHPRNRYEPGLYEKEKEGAYSSLVSGVLVGETDDSEAKEVYGRSFSRFHISHIGMSSFDRVTMLFMKNDAGLERIVWKGEDNHVRDAYFPVGDIERIFSDASSALKLSIDSFSRRI